MADASTNAQGLIISSNYIIACVSQVRNIHMTHDDLVKRVKLIYKVDKEKESTEHDKDHFTVLPEEILRIIISYCSVGAILSLSRTCWRFYNAANAFDARWRRLCSLDFDVHLHNRGKFLSYYEIYRLLYCSRILLGSYIYGRYYGGLKMINIPPWLLVWASLSNKPPIMKFGRHRIKRRINGTYLKRLHDISHGQLRKTFNLNRYGDLLNLHPTRMERGTIYFSWLAVKCAGIRKHDGSFDRYQDFLLNKCYRSRGFIERNYSK